MMIRILTLVAALIAGAQVATAQEAPATVDTPAVEAVQTDTGAAEAAPEVVPEPEPQLPLVIGGVDYTAWEAAAARGTAILAQERPTAFALEQLRETLVTWRDRFLAAQEARAPRLSTVDAQIAALGAVPADGNEDPLIGARRQALADERNALRAPNILAQEAYAQASGMIAEVDSLQRSRRTSELTGRDLSPFNPANWGAMWTDLSGLSASYTREAMVTFTSQSRLDVLKDNWLRVVVLLAVAGLLLFQGRHWVRKLANSASARTPRGQGVVALLLSLGQLLLPYLGLTAIVAAVTSSGLAGYRVNQVIGAIPQAGFYIFIARWLAEQIFGQQARVRLPITLNDDDKRRARRLVHIFGWGLFAGHMVATILNAGEVANVTRAAVTLPVQIVQAWSLWSFAALMLSATDRDAAARALDDQAETKGFTHLLVRLGARIFQILAVAGPVLTALGYSIAGEAVTDPALMTLGLIGIVLILQTFVYDLYGLVTGAEEGARDALIPVLIAVVLVLAALPVLALFWGVRAEELAEIWARFREGYTLGETRISPMDFFLCVVIFLLGLGVTRLVQGVMRNTILPKTRLDSGAQTALISGVGYIGIAIAVVFAVTAVGLDLSNLAVVVSALSVGIGFGMQNIVQNFISGIILLIERPISEGDWIEVGGKQGYVREISVRSTRIETFDRTQVIVPNADFVSGQVTNWTRGSSVGRVVLPIAVAYGSDTDKVIATLREIGESHPMVLLNPPPSVGMTGFGADALNFELRVIVRDVNFGGTVRSELNQAIVKTFADVGIDMPFPQRDVHVYYPEGREDREATRAAAAASKVNYTGATSGALPQKDEHADDPDEDVK